MGCHLISWGLAGRGGGVLYRMCTEMPSTAHAQWWLSTPLAREYVCQWCGKALPPLGIEPLSPSSQSQSTKRQSYLDIGGKSQIPEGGAYPHHILTITTLTINRTKAESNKDEEQMIHKLSIFEQIYTLGNRDISFQA